VIEGKRTARDLARQLLQSETMIGNTAPAGSECPS
jgi:hypothetical protein